MERSSAGLVEQGFPEGNVQLYLQLLNLCCSVDLCFFNHRTIECQIEGTLKII